MKKLIEKYPIQIQLATMVSVIVFVITMTFQITRVYSKFVNVETVVNKHETQIEVMREDTTEIKTDIKWIRETLVDIKNSVK